MGPKAEQEKLLGCLRDLPNLVQNVLDKEALPLRPKGDVSPARSPCIGECTLWDIGCQNVLANNFIFLGRGFNFPIALEGAMKCKEIAYIHAEGYPAAEMKHGPIALIDQFMPVVVIAPVNDPNAEKLQSNIGEVLARGGSVIAISEETKNEDLEAKCEYVVHVPNTEEFLMPLLTVIPLQLMSYYIADMRQCNVDQPRNLAKSVTVE